jgi:peptidoglycan-associated lipoprotein
MRLLLAAGSVCVLLSACSAAPEKVASSSQALPSTTSQAPVVASVATEFEMQRQERIMKALSGKSIFFDYDDYTIKPQYGDLIKDNHEFLTSAPAVYVTLEGNADERGSTEYNLALGQRRAEAVKRALGLMGMSEQRMEATSYGKEKPRATCHDEPCWAENRRVDLRFRPAATGR